MRSWRLRYARFDLCESGGKAVERVKKGTREFEIHRYEEGVCQPVADCLIEEAPLSVYLNGEETVTLMCTPQHLEELAVGFLVSEGFIQDRKQLAGVELDDSAKKAYVTLSESCTLESSLARRYLTTGCGKGSSFQDPEKVTKIRVPGRGLRIAGSVVLELMRRVERSSELFVRTGAVHCVALCNPLEVVLFREDIGRHNAVDKIVGRCFMDGIPLEDKVLVTTGRVSSEIAIKTAKFGIELLVSRSAPTAMAVEIARETGLTVIGFARGSRFNIYSHPYRIIEG